MDSKAKNSVNKEEDLEEMIMNQNQFSTSEEMKEMLLYEDSQASSDFLRFKAMKKQDSGKIGKYSNGESSS